MSRKHLIPGDPLQFIRRCVIQGKILWTYHVNMRLKGRSISRDAIIDSHDRYEIIERYSNDKYFPSYLVRSDDIKMIYCTFYLQLTRKLIIFGLLPPTAQPWGSGRMVSKLGGDLHEMPFMWFKVRAFNY